MQVEVERDRPHHDQPSVQVLNLPAHGAAGASSSASLESYGYGRLYVFSNEDVLFTFSPLLNQEY